MLAKLYRSLFALLAVAVLAAATNVTIPAPVVVGASQYWEGNDGPWSTFTIQIGTPPQNVRLLISTSSSTTFVVIPEGCTPYSPSISCSSSRGSLFTNRSSTSWQYHGLYTLGIEENLGIVANAQYGFDQVGIGWQGSSGMAVLNDQSVAGFAAEGFWLGLFGLNPRPINFTDFNDPQLSFVGSLKNRSLIPSLSWSYGAGARYRGQGVFGSLVFGGFDASKAGSPNMTFPFGPDQSRDLSVGLQAISGSIAGQKQWDLLPQGIFTLIDSATPYIWLPVASCQAFERAFGLIWNETVGLYLVNDTLHTKLVNQNASITFKMGNATSGGSTIDITLPYASFDLMVGFPIVENNTRYFPIMRAANSTQYTLGRTFLQEAYLTADYERSEFVLSQANYAGAPQHIISIPSLNSTSSGSSGNNGTSGGTTPPTSGGPKTPILPIVIGVTVGTTVLLSLAIAFIIICRRRRNPTKSNNHEGSTDTKDPVLTETYAPDKKDSREDIAEVDAGPLPPVRPVSEIPDTSTRHHELMSPTAAARTTVVFEMMGDEPMVQELQSPDRRMGEVVEMSSPPGIRRLVPDAGGEDGDVPSPLMGRVSPVDGNRGGRVSRAMSDVSAKDEGGAEKDGGLPRPVEGSVGVSPVARLSS